MRLPEPKRTSAASLEVYHSTIKPLSSQLFFASIAFQTGINPLRPADSGSMPDYNRLITRSAVNRTGPSRPAGTRGDSFV
jgi:hypothetical protein